jgi:hypothetical protein
MQNLVRVSLRRKIERNYKSTTIKVVIDNDIQKIEKITNAIGQAGAREGSGV